MCSRIVFLDIFKAFERVHHGGLLFKLKQLGVVDTYLNLFASYLSNRSQHVSLGIEKSALLFTNCGVPQGSIFGPLLFLIFANDIHKSIMSDIKLFADDTALLYSTPSHIENHQVLEED